MGTAYCNIKPVAMRAKARAASAPLSPGSFARKKRKEIRLVYKKFFTCYLLRFLFHTSVSMKSKRVFCDFEVSEIFSLTEKSLLMKYNCIIF